MTALAVKYEPQTWNDEQRECHMASNLDKAFYNASALSGGWYRRPVTIYIQVTKDLNEVYDVRPSDAPAPEGFRPVYKVERLGD